jgi:hypothetical protein
MDTAVISALCLLLLEESPTAIAKTSSKWESAAGGICW